MPWELTIRRRDGTRLGTQEAVRLGIATALPETVFYREPSGIEKIEALRALGQEFPDALRQHLERRTASEQGDYDEGGFSIRFYLGSGSEIEALEAEVRGSVKQSLPHLQRLAELNRWVISESGKQESMVL